MKKNIQSMLKVANLASVIIAFVALFIFVKPQEASFSEKPVGASFIEDNFSQRPIGLEQVLSEADQNLYKQIFYALSNKNWNTTDVLLAKVENKILKDYVLAEKYLSIGYVSNYDQLLSWLKVANYNSYYSDIYKLARKKRSKYNLPLVPYNATNSELSTDISEDDFDSFSIKFDKYDKKQLTTSYPTSKGMNTTFDEGYPILSSPQRIMKSMFYNSGTFSGNKYYRSILSGKVRLSYKNLSKQLSYIKLESIKANFLNNNPKESLRIYHKDLYKQDFKNISSRRAGFEWWAGLSAYVKEDFKTAYNIFSSATNKLDKTKVTNYSSALHYWAAKSATKIDLPEIANEHYSLSARNLYNYYGLLSSHTIDAWPRRNWLNINSDMENFSRHPMYSTILALIEVGRVELADKEMIRLLNVKNYRNLLAISSIAEPFGLARTSYVASYYLNNFYKINYMPASYPIPYWMSLECNIEDISGNNYSLILNKILMLSIARQESGFNNYARSNKDALGVLQILPTTAKFMNKGSLMEARNSLTDYRYSIKTFDKFITYLKSDGMIRNNYVSLLAAYNGGLGNTRKWLSNYKDLQDSSLMTEIMMFSETRNYIRKVAANFMIYSERLCKDISSYNKVFIKA